MSTLRLEIVTPERIVYEQDVNMVIANGVSGQLGVLPNHVPMVTPLKIAPIRVKKGNSEELIAVHGGFMEVRKEKVVILAEAAEQGADIDLSRARQAKERAEQRLASKNEQYDHKRAELALQRALTRIQTSGQ
ncbi:F0F1 ATP synthase subunit epsilon [Cohnella thailandensis]|uniref:ATP synthase epsilon chain n=1 Tax=Cohnella thailandensis TaxID=557557 RepID=A0A841T1Q1_9BACL|nr:F0F1 ATP synthase subunit epsilon [Cohnella thailandensis]MBB6638094.1 F0F1 ATP synthase subunit epsilon [Cohnella thailandensis]MBP1971980.1 F-type H+-transporting ATPase subunit epsilon [Cohnella thailandensis]